MLSFKSPYYFPRAIDRVRFVGQCRGLSSMDSGRVLMVELVGLAMDSWETAQKTHFTRYDFLLVSFC